MESNGPSILIVDDDPICAQYRAELFRRLGFEVATAWNGEEALGLLRRGYRAGVILLDLVMPTMNGWKFRAVQLADPTLRGIPVVIVSTAAHESPSVRADFPGAHFARSDLDPTRFIALVRSVMTRDLPGASPAR